jgi:hypothetical protein
MGALGCSKQRRSREQTGSGRRYGSFRFFYFCYLLEPQDDYVDILVVKC